MTDINNNKNNNQEWFGNQSPKKRKHKEESRKNGSKNFHCQKNLKQPQKNPFKEMHAKAFLFLFQGYKNYLKSQNLEEIASKTQSKLSQGSRMAEGSLEEKKQQLKFWSEKVQRLYKVSTSSANWNPDTILTYSYILFKRTLSKCMNPKISKKPPMKKIYQFFLLCVTLTIKFLFDDEEEILDFIFEVARIFMTEIFDLENIELELLVQYMDWEDILIKKEDYDYELRSIKKLFSGF